MFWERCCSFSYPACNVRAPALQYIFTLTHKRHDFRGTINWTQNVSSFYTTFVRNISDSKKKWFDVKIKLNVKVKVIPQQAEVAQGVPRRLRPRIFLTFGTTRVVGRQPYTPAAFTLGEIPGTRFQGLSRPHSTWFLRGEPRKKSPVTSPGIDPGTVRLVAQCLNHYATPGPDLM